MGKDGAVIRREFVMKQIENEITAGFAFVAAARRAYRLSGDPAEAEGALTKAAETHEQISKEVADSDVARVRIVTRQLMELREAIDWLRETHFTPATGK